MPEKKRPAENGDVMEEVVKELPGSAVDEKTDPKESVSKARELSF